MRGQPQTDVGRPSRFLPYVQRCPSKLKLSTRNIRILFCWSRVASAFGRRVTEAPARAPQARDRPAPTDRAKNGEWIRVSMLPKNAAMDARRGGVQLLQATGLPVLTIDIFLDLLWLN